jgi:hypothetical protein
LPWCATRAPGRCRHPSDAGTPPAGHQALALFHLLASDRRGILSRDRLGPDDLAFLKATRGLQVEAALRYTYD